MLGPIVRPVVMSPRLVRILAATLCVVLVGVVLWQLPGALGGPGASPSRVASADQSPSGIGLSAATPTPSAIASATASGVDPTATAAVLSPDVGPTATATPRPNPTRTPSPTVGPTRTDRPWQPDPILTQAKNEGRVTVDSGGHVVILGAAPPPPTYPAAASLNTSWSGLIQEPPRTGTDDKGHAYTDYNYSSFCGAGTGAVVLYYWPAARSAVTTKAGTFVEPVNLGANRYASTYWNAQDAGGYGRGMIMYLAEVEWPPLDQGLSWWANPGVMRWETNPSTYVENLVDAINWEASAGAALNYFYVIVPASGLTATALRDHVHADIAMGVPVVIAARTSDGTNSLPFWNVKSTRSAVNHFVTVVGYDDTAGTYSVMDTCGVTCNDRTVRSGVGSIGQDALFSLIGAESDNDGIMW
jgi:hypothetical protein